MGDIYSIEVQVKTKDEKRLVKFFKEEIISKSTDRVDWSLEKWYGEGKTLETMDDCFSLLLAGWNGQKVEVCDDGEWKVYENGFSASYGWARVMGEVFVALCQADLVEDGSHIDIFGDDYGSYKLTKDSTVADKYTESGDE